MLTGFEACSGNDFERSDACVPIILSAHTLQKVCSGSDFERCVATKPERIMRKHSGSAELSSAVEPPPTIYGINMCIQIYE